MVSARFLRPVRRCRFGEVERDRVLFKRYVPLCKIVSEAGWRPVNKLVATNTPSVRVEQFGSWLSGGTGRIYDIIFSV